MEKLIQLLKLILASLSSSERPPETPQEAPQAPVSDVPPASAPLPPPAPKPVPATVPESEPTKREKLYEAAYACLGIDMAPTQNELGCAEALSFVMKKAGVPGLPKAGITGTAALDAWLAKKLTRVDSPLPGDVVMSPTGTGNGSVRGHAGIVGKHQIMSNNSVSFKWDNHWTLPKWRAHYGRKGGLPVKFYRWI